MSGSSNLEARVARLLAGDPDELAHPYETWNELRETRPVLKMNGLVVLSRHADVRVMLGDNHVLYSRADTRYTKRYEQARESFSLEGRAAFDRVLDREFNQIVRMDPPAHPRVRKVVTPPFAARSLAKEMDAVVQLRVKELLDEMASAGGRVDFKKVAYTLPLNVLGDLLGIPLEDLDGVHDWAFKIAENKNNSDSESAAVDADEAYIGLVGYIERLVAEQSATGQSTGLVSALLAALHDGTIDYSEMISMLALMIFAGHETTSNLLSIGLYELLRHRDQWQLLCEDPSLTEAAVEELLRFVSPAHFAQVSAIQHQELHGETIDPGDVVVGVIAAANRDPEIFDHPDMLEVRRADSRQHVSLGMGPHFCLGAGLARMEAMALMRQLVERFPELELTGEPLRWGGRALRTPASMPVLVRG
jgi:cytochrome P450